MLNKISDKSNVDIISSLVSSRSDKEDLIEYVESNEELDLNSITMSEFLKWIWLDRHEIINNNEELKSYFVNYLMKEYQVPIVAYRGISFDKDTVIDLDSIKEQSFDKLISTTKDIDTAKSFAISYNRGVLLKCVSKKYIDLSDFDVNNEKEIIMLDADMEIIDIVNNDRKEELR